MQSGRVRNHDFILTRLTSPYICVYKFLILFSLDNSVEGDFVQLIYQITRNAFLIACTSLYRAVRLAIPQAIRNSVIENKNKDLPKIPAVAIPITVRDTDTMMD